MTERMPVLLLMLVFFGCGKEVPSLDNFDAAGWASDKTGCAGVRLKNYASLIDQKQKLLGRNEMAIIEILGRPERNELSKRNEKFYYYFISSEACDDLQGNESKALLIRFNSLGSAKEIQVENLEEE